MRLCVTIVIHDRTTECYFRAVDRAPPSLSILNVLKDTVGRRQFHGVLIL